MEMASHVELFKMIYRTAINENEKGNIPENVKTRGRELIKSATELEKRWGNYACKGLLGFSEDSIKIFVENRANDICRNMWLDPIYPDVKNDPLDKLLRKYLVGTGEESRQKFFEQNVLNYNHGGMSDDWD